ncbi:hypothetical protein L6452_33029 [Arctium lappa]|uniref:Uncharacterized protein n=1 Tax=Arctium lappa TaxID=4217 RepID=A0ACB8Z760_ARCLA|nr:hypothetical protein L6452_33029 [Arctium lappa]
MRSSPSLHYHLPSPKHNHSPNVNLDAIEEIDSSSTLLADTKYLMQNSTHYTSCCLAIVSKIYGVLGKLNLQMHRKLLGGVSGMGGSWSSETDGSLLVDQEKGVLRALCPTHLTSSRGSPVPLIRPLE